MLDDELDKVIDEVAQAMTAAPADAQLAHRISARLADAGAPPARPGWARPWLLVPLASACVLLLAVFVVRDRSVRPSPDAPNSERVHPSAGRGFQPRLGGPERAALQPAERAALQPAERTTLRPVAEPVAAAPSVAAPSVASGVSRTNDVATAHGATRIPLAIAVAEFPAALRPIEVDLLEVPPLARSEQIEITDIAIDRIEISAMP
jgi:hypothetical protein